MHTLVSDLEHLLYKYGVLGSQYSNWQFIQIDHSNNLYDDSHLKKFRSIIGKQKGIYVYTNTIDDTEKVLYVGKSQDIASRLSIHYKERHDRMGMPRWRRFWQYHTCIMKVYYIGIDYDEDSYIDEALRIIVERYLIAKLKPISEQTYKSVK